MLSTSVDHKHVSGIFAETVIENVLADLESLNIQPADISVLMSENSGSSLIKLKGSNKASEGATIGGISGGVLGAIAGGLTLVGSILAPGIGLLAVGPLVGILAGTAAGVSAGGLLGGLIGMGVPENEAKYYENALKEQGNVLVVVNVPKDETAEVKTIFTRYNVQSMHG